MVTQNISKLLYIGIDSKIYRDVTSATYNSRIGLSEKNGKYNISGSESELVGAIDSMELLSLISKITPPNKFDFDIFDYKYIRISIKYPFTDDDIKIMIQNLYNFIKGYTESKDIELSPYIVVKQTKSTKVYNIYTYISIFIPNINVKYEDFTLINIHDLAYGEKLDNFIKCSIYESINDDCKNFNYKLAENLRNAYLKDKEAINNNLKNKITKVEYAEPMEL